MGTNKDQAQAHQFMLQRVVSAITVQEPDPEQPPFRRPTLAAIGGIAIAILLLAGFWVFGLIVPGGGKTFADKEVIAVEEETGARYVLLNGRLHPVLNYTSGLLALDKHAKVEVVSRDTLAGLPIGPPIGIPGAPDSLPGKDQLVTDGWSMCDQSTVDDQGRGRDTPVLLVGQPTGTGGTPAGQALVVHADDRIYVVYSGYRHEIAANVDVAMELNKESAVRVSSTWLDTVPAGKPIAPIPLDDAGQPSTAVPTMSLVAGQLLQVAEGLTNGETGGREPQYYLVRDDHLQPISPLQASIQQVLGAQAEAPIVVENRQLVDAVLESPRRPAEGDPPRVRPPFLVVDNADATVCAEFRPGTAVPTVSVGATLPASILSAPDGPIRVAVPAKRAALIEVMSGPDEPAGQGTIALVTDQGRLHPLSDPGHVMQVLGYDGVAPVRITAALADRVPRGESLSPAAARTPAPEE